MISSISWAAVPLYAAGVVLERFTLIGPLLMDRSPLISPVRSYGWLDFASTTPEIADDIGDLT